MRTVMAVGLVLAMAGLAAAASDILWWEAETPQATNFPGQTWFSPQTDAERDVLSGGAWLSSAGQRGKDPLFAVYEVNVPAAGSYHFWVRKFWHHGPFRWRWGTGPWQTCGRDCLLADSVSLRTHVGANWVPLGQVQLGAGPQTLRIELLAAEGEDAASAFDCFLLAPGVFFPRGKLKPGETYGRAPEGWFPFEPGVDPFKESPIDLRPLNHKVAGEKGFLQSKGMDFVFEREGKPVRFWAVNAGPMATKELDRYFARQAAKRGVNMVRIHSAVFDQGAPDPATVDRAYLDRLHHFVAALKAEGIYVHLSFYFPLWFDVKPEYGIPGYEALKNKKPFALLFFHPRMQEIYKAWATGLLTTRNPYTGVALAKDPAVGLVEIINEDNYFFWTTTPYENLSAEATHLLEARFGAWLAKRYGSLAKAMEAWGPSSVKGDDPAAGRAGLYPPWTYTDGARNARNEKRIHDQARFLTQDLRGFYETMHQWFRSRLGVRCPVVATNWVTADNRLLGPLDKYTNMACETLDRHAYFQGKHEGDGAGYSVRQGHRYQDRCALLEPQESLVRELQYAGHTHIVTEYSYPMPNRFRADSVPLAAAYGSLGGTDAWFHFAVGSAGWQETTSKWPLSTPAVLGQFPAAALLYRLGYVQEGPVVAHEALRLEDLYELKGGAIDQPQNLDDLRQADIPPGAKGEVPRLGTLDPLAYFVGQVTRTVADDPGKSLVQDLSACIDRSRKVVKSMTGQLAWDWGAGLVTINAPAAQGATGYLAKAGAVELADVAIRSRNEYGTVLVVSLDGQPLKTSARVLVQVMTEDANYGWQTSGDGTRTLTDLGGPPMVVLKFAGTVTLKRPDAASLKVRALDANGYPRQDLAGGRSDAVTVDLLPDAMYYVIER